MRRLRVAIVEPSVIIAEGLAGVVEGGNEYEVVFIAESMRTLVERFAVVAPDVVIVGSQVICGVQSIRTQYQELQGVALALLSTTVCDEEYVRQFDGVINIYDDRSQVLRKLGSVVEQAETNP